MNHQCPNCRAPIVLTEANFGSLYLCESCSANYFIDWDGNPEGSFSQSEDEVNELDLAVPDIEPSPWQPIAEKDLPTLPEPVELGMSPNPEPIPDITPDVILTLEEPIESYKSKTMSEHMVEIENFANSDNIVEIQYTLRVSEIDEDETKKEIESFFKTKRLGLGNRPLQIDLKKGWIELNHLNPATLLVILKGIQFLPIQIEITQEDRSYG